MRLKGRCLHFKGHKNAKHNFYFWCNFSKVRTVPDLHKGKYNLEIPSINPAQIGLIHKSPDCVWGNAAEQGWCLEGNPWVWSSPQIGFRLKSGKNHGIWTGCPEGIVTSAEAMPPVFFCHHQMSLCHLQMCFLNCKTDKNEKFSFIKFKITSRTSVFYLAKLLNVHVYTSTHVYKCTWYIVWLVHIYTFNHTSRSQDWRVSEQIMNSLSRMKRN